jgi:hypothetical protein
MHDKDDQSAKPKAPLWLRALEAVGLLALFVGLASSTWWLAGLGFAVVPLSYLLYRRPRGNARPDGSGEGGGLGYDIDGGDGGGGD